MSNAEKSCFQPRRIARLNILSRMWAYNLRIPLLDLVKAYKAHCRNTFEVAEYLDVSEDTLKEALEFYRQKYGIGVMVGDYYIRFEPHLDVFEYRPL